MRNQTKGEEFDIIHPHRNKSFPFACKTHLILTFCWKMRNLIINLYNLIYKRQSCSLFCTIPFREPAGSYSTYMASVCMAFYRVVGQVEGGFVRLMKKKIKRDDVLRLGELMNVHPKEPPRPHSLIAD